MASRRSAFLRAGTTLILGSISGVVVFTAMRANYPPPPAAEPAKDWQQQPDDPRLDKIVDAVDFDSEKFSDVLREFARSQNLNVGCKWKSLEKCQLGPDDLITLHLRKARVRQVLDDILSAGSADFGAAWLDVDGVITIAWRDELDNAEPITERLYDVSPLMTQSQRFTLRFPRRSSVSSWPMSGMSIVVPGTTPVSRETDQIDEIVLMLMNTAAPGSWRDNGGDIGTISYTGNGKILVRQTRSSQLKIQRLLSLLESDH